MTPQMNNVLLHILNKVTETHNLLEGIWPGTGKAFSSQYERFHPFTATGEDLDDIAEQVGLPRRMGVPVPDETVRAAILAELDTK